MYIVYKYKKCSKSNYIECEKLISLIKLNDYHKISYLYISNNYIFSICELPKSLIKLDCYFNRLCSLPKLPSSITRINCSSNKLILLPKLPNSLKFLDCSYNKLILLPEIPNSLEYISCEGNKFIKKYNYKYLNTFS
jgi:Leucine-rich repeat (LRR) protein